MVVCFPGLTDVKYEKFHRPSGEMPRDLPREIFLFVRLAPITIMPSDTLSLLPSVVPGGAVNPRSPPQQPVRTHAAHGCTDMKD